MANKLVVSLAIVLALVAFVATQSIPDQDWGYVTVRPKAHMFWYASSIYLLRKIGLLIDVIRWLYGTSNKAQRPQTPLVMWYVPKKISQFITRSKH